MTRSWFSALLALGACAQPPAAPAPAPSPLAIPAKFERAEDVLVNAWPVRALAALVGGGPRVTGSIMVPMSTKACESPWLGVLPYVTWAPREPRVGEMIEVEWTTLAMAAPRDWAAVVLCGRKGTRHMHASGIEVDGVELGALGTVFVDIDPKHARWVAPGGEGTLISRRAQDAGRIRMRWTPTPDQLGEVWWFHLVCFGLPLHVAPSGGILISPGLRIEVGSAR